jgi:large subunit ribosomal protein L19
VDLIRELEKEQMREKTPQFNIGDTVAVHAKIIEGGKERIQVFQGVVIRRRMRGLRSSFTVRKISHHVGVEKSFLLHSPRIEKVVVKRQGKVRRAKLYYLREKVGKKARVKEARR